MGWSWFVGTEREAPFAGLVAFGGVGDADAGRGGELEDRAVAFKPKTFGGDEILAVEGAVDLKKLGQLARTACALDAANQHRLRTTFNACHDVQHFMHPVAKIDVGATAGRIHHVGARGPSLVRMAGGILFAAVVALIFVGYLVYREQITLTKLAGIAVCLIGLYLINK